MVSKRLFSQNIDDSLAMLEKLFKNFESASSADQDRFVAVLISKPGLGKSAAVTKMAKRMGYDLISLNLSQIEVTDILGLGAREKIDGRWMTMPALPVWTERLLAGNTILFLDEFNNTTQDVLSGFQILLSDFKISERDLPRTTHIIGACNPPGKDAIYAAKKLSGAFRRRLCMLPIVDDFEYVMKKHNFTMPRGFMQIDYDDLMNYCEYDEVSSAVVDNIFNIVRYPTLTNQEKVTLISGFGNKAFEFVSEMELLPATVLASGRAMADEDITYSEWKKAPGDQVSEFQQILWGQESLQNSCSYSRSKKFVSRVTNPSVYAALRDMLKNKFDVEFAVDDTPLPPERVTKKGLPAGGRVTRGDAVTGEAPEAEGADA